MNILIICNDFEPLNSVGAQRPQSWWRYFSSLDDTHVSIVTKNWSPNTSLAHEVQVFDEEKVDEYPHGTIYRVPNHKDLTERFVARFGHNRFNVIRKALTFICKLSMFSISYFDKHRNLHRKADSIIANNKIDVVITTGEPFINHKYGYLLKSKYPHIKWIADFRDGWYLNHTTVATFGVFGKFILNYEWRYEKKFMQKADLITSVDPMLTERIANLHNRPSACVYNGFDGFFEEPEQVTNSKALLIIHGGTMTQGQQIEVLLAALVELISTQAIQASDVKLEFLGLDFFPKQVQRVRQFSPVLKDVVSTTPRVSHLDALRRMKQADYLLSLTDPNFTTLYTKTYDYIAVQKPMLLVLDDKSLLCALVHSLENGIVARSKEHLKTIILQAINDKQAGKTTALHLDKTKASFYLRTEQAKRFRGIIENLVKS